MKNSVKKTLLCMVFFVFGCQSVEVLDQNNTQQYTHFSELTYVKLNSDEKYKFEINKDTQRLISDDINSPVIGVLLPKNKSNLNLTMVSQFDKTVYAPSVIFLNKEWQPVGELSFKEFHYQKPELYRGNEMVKELSLNDGFSADYTYMVIYTAAEDLDTFTLAIHPDRLKAELRGEELGIDDIKVRHSQFGHFTLSVETLAITNKPQSKPSTLSAKPAEYYFSKIERLVNEGEIEQAFLVRDEAKSNGFDGADKVFSSALKNTAESN